MPLVTVGMPVYNAAPLLPRGLDCICNQSFEDIQIVISDNASTDETPDITKDYAARDSRISLLRQLQNVGMIENFAKVLEAAQTPYFMWRAHDDTSDLDYIRSLYTILSEDSLSGMAAPLVDRRSIDGRISARARFPELGPHETRRQRVRKLLRTVQASWFYGLYRTEELRAAWKQVTTRYPYIWAFDHLLLLQFVLKARVNGTNDAKFTQLETGVSQETYRPTSASKQRQIARCFLSFALHELRSSSSSPTDQFALVWPLLKYTNGKTVKYRRIAIGMVKEVGRIATRSGDQPNTKPPKRVTRKN